MKGVNLDFYKEAKVKKGDEFKIIKRHNKPFIN